MKQITLIITLNICFFSFGQSLIKGTVSDESGPLAGANVIVKNSTIGVATDFEGNFQFKASPSDTISFSYLGYRPKDFIVGNQKEIDVKLESNIDLDEIIVCAYGATTTCTISTRCGFTCNATACGIDILKEPSNLAGQGESKLFPNPSPDGLFHLESNETFHKVEINVATMNGQMVKNIKLTKVEGNMDIDLSNLTSGIYIMNIIADGKKLKPQKAIK